MCSLKEKFIQTFEKFKRMKFRKKLIVVAAILAVIFLVALAFGASPKEVASWMGLLLVMILRGDAAILIWRAAGRPFWQTCLFLMIITTISLTLVYFLTGHAKKELTKDAVKKRFEKSKFAKIWVKIFEFFKERKKRWQEKIIHFLEDKSPVFVFLFNLIPVPILPTAIIIVTRLREIKYGFLILAVSNVIRVYITCWCIWQGINLFKLLFS